MQRRVHSTCLLLLAASLFAGEKPWTVDDLLSMPSVSDPQIRPDGGAYAYVVRELDRPRNRFRGTLFVVDLASGKTISTPSASSPRWSPDGKSLAYILSGEVRLVNPARQITQSISGVHQFRWSADGQSIAYIATEPIPAEEAARLKAGDDVMVADRNYKFAGIYVQPLSGGPPKRITKAGRHVVSFDWSAGGTKFVYAAQPTPRPRDAFDADLYEVDAAAGRETTLVMQAGRDGDPSYSPDGRWVAFHSQAGKPNYFEARHVGLVASGGGRIRYLTEGKDYDVFRGGARFHWSMDGREIFYLAGRSVHDYLYRQNLETGAASVVLESVSGAFSFTPDGKRAVFLQSALYRPAEVFLYEQGKTTQLTRVFDSLGSHPRVQSKAVRWKSRDGLEVEGILWLPFDYKAGTRVPLLTELHGGPTGVILDLFPGSRTYPIQVFLDHGYAVFAPNFRGSVNYGAPFRMKIAQSQGFGDFDDMNTGIDKLIADGIADPDRLGVMGWSYGGYLSAWTIGHTNRFKAASVGAPATDWATYYGQSDGARTVLWTYFGGTPWAKPENYARHSPRAGLANVTTPTLLQVGERDINHNAEIFQALTDLGVPVEYAVYPREGHGIAEPAHQRDLMQRNFDWFERWLKR